MVPWEAGKLEYTEQEAAVALGISVEKLRCLVREHVTKDETGSADPVPVLRPTDLLLLKMLAQSPAA